MDLSETLYKESYSKIRAGAGTRDRCPEDGKPHRKWNPWWVFLYKYGINKYHNTVTYVFFVSSMYKPPWNGRVSVKIFLFGV